MADPSHDADRHSGTDHDTELSETLEAWIAALASALEVDSTVIGRRTR